MKPYVVSEMKDQDGNTVSKAEPTTIRQVISEDTSKKVCQMMQSVVDNGTGKNAYVAGYKVGGKTGTSTKLGESKEGEKNKYIVSFAAIAPADDPEIAMIIICDEPNVDLGGGAICAPVAATVIKESMAVLGVEPSYTEEEKKTLSVKAPNVIAKSVSDAEAAIKSAGLDCKVVGTGDKITSQSPAAGNTVPSGGQVVLYTSGAEKETVTVPDFTGLTVSQANSLAASSGLNIEISGNASSDALVVAYKQSEDQGKEVDAGTVITVSFKSTKAVLD
jgi:stage V sporulation protein D (sporulation-specific penicillin-binding protein)